MAAPLPKLRPDVSLPGLLSTVHRAFEAVPDKRRQASVKYSMPDTLMAGLAIFSLKYPSLLMFDQHARQDSLITQSNLQSLFGLTSVPCDTQLRTILDPVQPEQLRPAFRAIHSGLQRSNSLRDYRVRPTFNVSLSRLTRNTISLDLVPELLPPTRGLN